MTKTCRTCCRPIASPYRRHDVHGVIIEGCVASDHDGRLCGESARWHNRPVAKAMRRATAAHLRSMLLGAPRANREAP